MKRRLSLLMLLAGLAWQGSSLAIGLGEMRLRTALGEPLRAEVEIFPDRGEDLSPNCFTLNDSSSPELLEADAWVVLETGRRPRLRLLTSRPIKEPVLDVGLSVSGCGLVSLERQYVLLLSPRAERPAGEGVGPERPGPAPVDATPPRPARAALPESRADRPANTEKSRTPRPTTGISAPYSPAPRRPSPDDRKPSSVPQPRPDARPPPAAAAPVLPRPASPLPATPGADSRNGSATGATPPVPEATPPAAAAPSVPRPVPETHVPTAPVPEVQPPVAAEPPPSVPDASGPVAPRDAFWPTLATLLGLGLILALGFHWRAMRRQAEWRRNMERLLAPTVGPQPIAEPRPPAQADVAPAKAVEILLDETPETGPDALRELLDNAHRVAMPGHVRQEESQFSFGLAEEERAVVPARQETPLEQVMELAEIMLAFGRSREAVEVLSSHIQQHPGESVDPWMKLLELYRQSDSHFEFDSLANQIRQHFNVAPPQWDDLDDMTGGNALGLENLPHIAARLTEVWGTDEALAYLEHLLRDNRGGQRQGFAMPIVREILFLRELIKGLPD